MIKIAIIIALFGMAHAGAPHIPNYRYGYAVNDHLTGDNKFQDERRVGGVVEGSYGLREADGTFRRVVYHSDPITGFKATVERHGKAVHFPGAPVAALPVAVAPVPLAPAYYAGGVVAGPAVVPAALPLARPIYGGHGPVYGPYAPYGRPNGLYHGRGHAFRPYGNGFGYPYRHGFGGAHGAAGALKALGLLGLLG